MESTTPNHECHDWTPLRNRLDALSYTQPLDPKSVPLVTALLDDFLQMAESHRNCKMESEQHLQQIFNFNSQMDALVQENGRLVAENNQLHVDVMTAAETAARQSREHYQTSKAMECEIAELVYWKKCTLKRLKELESENQGLKAKLNETLIHPIQDSEGLELSHVLSPKGEETGKNDSKVLVLPSEPNLLKPNESRIAELEEWNDQCKSKIEELESFNHQLEEAVRLRDGEIQRLGKELEQGPDIEKLQLRQRNEANESVILTLNQQVEYLTTQLGRLEEEIKDKEKLERSYEASEKKRVQGETEHTKTTEQNAVLTRQVLQLSIGVFDEIHDKVQHLQRTLAAYTLKRPRNGSPVKDADTSRTLRLLKELSVSKEGSEFKDVLIQNLEQEQTEWKKQNQELKNTISELERCLEAIQRERSSLKEQIDASRSEKGTLETCMDRQATQLEELHSSLNEMETTCSRLQKTLDEKQREVDDVLSRLKTEKDQRTTSEEKASRQLNRIHELEDDVSKIRCENRRFKTNLEVAEQELEAFREKTQASHKKILDLENALKTSREKEEAAQSLSTLLKSKTEELTKQNENLTLDLDRLQIETMRLTSTLSGLETEKQFLTERLSSITDAAKQRNALLQQSWLETAQSNKLVKQTEELYVRLNALTEERTQLENKVLELTNANLTLSEDGEKAKNDLKEWTRVVDDLRSKKQELEMELTSERFARSKSEANATRLDEDIEKLKLVVVSLTEETTEQRETLEERNVRLRERELDVHTLKQSLSSLKSTEDDMYKQIEKYETLLNQRSKELDQLRQERDALRAQLETLKMQLKQTESQKDELCEQTEKLKGQCESSRKFAEENENQNAILRKELTEKNHEVNLLTSLSLKGDATVQECMKRIQFLGTSFEAEQLKTGQLTQVLEAKDREIENKTEALEEANLCIQRLNIEKEDLQDALDMKIEELSAERINLKTLKQNLNELQQKATQLERQNESSNHRIVDLEKANENVLEAKMSIEKELHEKEMAFQKATEAFRAANEDLEMMVSENQQLSNELVQVQESFERLTEKHSETQRNLSDTEQIVQIKETDIEDLRQAYEDVANENRSIVNDLNEMERQLNELKSLSKNNEKERAMLKKECERLQEQNHQQLMDLRSYERQVDALSQELSKKEEWLDENGRQKTVLVEEVQCIERQSFRQENEIKECRKQLAQAENKIEAQQARLEDSKQEIVHLKHQLTFSREKIKELEILIVDLRSRKFHEQKQSHQNHPSKNSMFEQRNQLLESQNQVAFVEEAKAACHEELVKTKEENHKLNAILQNRAEKQPLKEEVQHDTERKQLKQMRQEINELQNQLETAKNEKEQILNTVQDLQNQIAVTKRPLDGSFDDGSTAVETGFTDETEYLEKIQRLEKQLEEERRRRNKAEKDFRRLVEITRDLAPSPEASNRRAVHTFSHPHS